jgi:hypothetical protein
MNERKCKKNVTIEVTFGNISANLHNTLRFGEGSVVLTLSTKSRTVVAG